MHKILIIEDEFELRESVAEILGFEGFEVIEAENGARGVEKALQHNPDVILCDIMMPVMNGFEVLKKLQEVDTFSQIPFIFITALADRINTREGMNLGADDYLTKPFTKDELLDIISSKLKQYGKIAQKIEQIEHDLSSQLDGLTQTNLTLKKEVKTKEEEMMIEALKVIETNNILSTMKAEIQKSLEDKNLSSTEKMHFVSLKNKLSQKTILSNSWTLFQLKFNQTYPNFITYLKTKHSNLTEYDLLLASTILSGLNNNQIADLLNVTAESARKSKYRLKKKTGLKKEEDLASYIVSFNK